MSPHGRAVWAVLMLAGLALPSPARAQTRRAVLVGINTYAPPSIERSVPSANVAHDGRRSPDVFRDLKGAVNDVTMMQAVLVERFGFKRADVHVVLDRAATRERVLGDIQKWLIDEAAPGDMSFFYYAGHGSQMRNSQSMEPDKLDETIVPADAASGALDIRDKEIARLFNEALKKNVLLTVGFDSCHSGSISRGQLRPTRVRNLVADLRDASDPSQPAALEAGGAVVLAAAQSHQLAGETVQDGQDYGLFTWALVKTMRTMPITESVDRMFASARGLVHSIDQSQDPDLQALPKRRHAPLFGSSGSLSGVSTVAVQSVDVNGTITLEGGLAGGLRKECELRMVGSQSDTTPLIRVTDTQGMALSTAVLIRGQIQSVRPGTLFEVIRWASPDVPALRVWTGANGLDIQHVSRAADRFSSIAAIGTVTWLDDPERDLGSDSPTGVIQWNGAGWDVLAAGDVVSLTDETAVETALSHVPTDGTGKRRVLFNLPLATEVKEQLGIGAGSDNDAIDVLSTPAGADYVIVGRRTGTVLEYAWAQPIVGRNLTQSALPVRTDWVSVDPGNPGLAAKTLQLQAVRLGVIKTWLQLESPAASNRIPYHLALIDTSSGETRTSGPVHGGDVLGLVLTRDETLTSANRGNQYVYVFIVDSSGRSTLLFPTPNSGGGGENYYPGRDQAGLLPAEIPLGPRQLFTVTPPFGADTYVLLTTSTPLSDPSVVEGEAVRSGEKRGPVPVDPLTRLLMQASGGRRSVRVLTPTDWTIERLVIPSVPASIK